MESKNCDEEIKNRFNSSFTKVSAGQDVIRLSSVVKSKDGNASVITKDFSDHLARISSSLSGACIQRQMGKQTQILISIDISIIFYYFLPVV